MYLPLQGMQVSNYRCLSGDWDIPLDAPIVLIHGPNASGKTSLLSAIELCLTGQIQSLRRLEREYSQHLPNHDHAQAAVGLSFLLPGDNASRQHTINIYRHGIEGSPALGDELARHYSERCYLDQSSLSRLLEIYQFSEDNSETALAKFVNELLGLDNLDALRSGLAESRDRRNLRKLATNFAIAEQRLKDAGRLVTETRREMVSVRKEHEDRLGSLRDELQALGHELPKSPDSDDLLSLTQLLDSADIATDYAAARTFSQTIAELRGRLEILDSRPLAGQIGSAQEETRQASDALEAWVHSAAEPIAQLRQDARSAGFDDDEGLADAIANEVARLNAKLEDHASAVDLLSLLAAQIEEVRSTLRSLQLDINEIEEQAGQLAPLLVAIRAHLVGDNCPVCGRDYAELQSGPLADYLDRNVLQLTASSSELVVLSDRQVDTKTELARLEAERTELLARVLDQQERDALAARRDLVRSIQSRLMVLAADIEAGSRLRARKVQAETELAELRVLADQHREIRSEIEHHLTRLDLGLVEPEMSPRDALERLNAHAQVSESQFASRMTQLEEARRVLAECVLYQQRVEDLGQKQVHANERREFWDTTIQKSNVGKRLRSLYIRQPLKYDRRLWNEHSPILLMLLGERYSCASHNMNRSCRHSVFRLQRRQHWNSHLRPCIKAVNLPARHR